MIVIFGFGGGRLNTRDNRVCLRLL
jgi:hypothetical protein